MKSGLERKGIRTGILRSHLPHQFVLCCWTSKRRQKLLEYVDKYEAILVLGCEAAVKTVHDTVKSTSCRVFQGMKTIGVMSIKPRFHLPCNISLEIDSLTPMIHQEQFSEAEIGA
jgi:hypothetical protein